MLFQAGASDAGRELAAREADAIFSGDVSDVARAKEYYDDIKGRAATYGRDPNQIVIMPAILPILGGTEEEALRKYNDVNALLDVDIAIKYLSRYFSFFDFSKFALDEPLPDLGDVGKDSFKSTAEHYKKVAKERNFTLRQLALYAASHGLDFVGTPEQVANKIQTLYENKVVDGFILYSYLQPLGLREFVDEVVPILQRRGIFRSDYEEDTLRGHLGIDFPVNRYTKA